MNEAEPVEPIEFSPTKKALAQKEHLWVQKKRGSNDKSERAGGCGHVPVPVRVRVRMRTRACVCVWVGVGARVCMVFSLPGCLCVSACVCDMWDRGCSRPDNHKGRGARIPIRFRFMVMKSCSWFTSAQIVPGMMGACAHLRRM